MTPACNTAGGEHPRPLQRSPSVEPGEIPVASFSDQSQTSNARTGDSLRLLEGFSQTQATGALMSSPDASQNYAMTPNAAAGELTSRDGLGCGEEQLPPSSAPASFVASQQSPPPPPLAQARVPWCDAIFPSSNLSPQPPLTWLPVLTPAQVAASVATQTPQTTQNPPPARAPRVDAAADTIVSGSGWKIVTRKKRLRGTPPYPSDREQRRRIEEMDMRAAMMDHSPGPGIPNPPLHEESTNYFGAGLQMDGRMGPPPTNPFEIAMQSASVFPSPSPLTTMQAGTLMRTPPSAPLSDSDYLNPIDSGVRLYTDGTPAIAAAVGMSAPLRHAEIDPARVMQPRAGRPMARSSDSASTVNVPLRNLGASGTLQHQFTLQTPRQQHDLFNPTSVRLPQRQPPPPPFAGPYTTRDLPPHRDHGLTPGVQTAPRLGPYAPARAPLRQLDEVTRGGQRYARSENISMDDRMDEGSDLPEDAQENLAPAIMLRPSSRLGPHFENQVEEDFRRLDMVRANESEIPPYHSTPPPPPLNPLTGRVSKVGQRQQPVMKRLPEPATQPCVLYPRMPAPREGYPRIRFQDPDSVVVGTDEAILADMRDTEKNGTILGIRVARVNGVPPDKMARNICSWVEAITTDITGETGISLVPPRPPYVRRQGNPAPFIWFLCDLSPEGAAVMLSVGVVSCPTISFFVHPLTVKPDLVVVLTGFVTTTGFLIEAMIRNTFEGPAMRAIIDQFVPSNPLFRNTPIDMATQFVLETLEIELDTLGGNVPCAKVYIESPAGTTEGWRRFREAVARVPFEDRYNPRASTRILSCEICAGSDHTMQMCRYPFLPGWKGPVPSPEPVHEEPTVMGSDLVFAPRQNGGNQRKQGGSGRGGGHYAQPGPSSYGGGQYGGGSGRGGAGTSGGSGAQGLRPY
ncbi:hypothetical protein K466DRAFT_595729 [Polyporus arcularius HHB13444]|uniref:Uncharacterized protein n=1 Tax=Polyporus arcularius HHB13444 TaxID=1314778 RepID=A0A5C3PRR3_9APHY|nr:hypothetical protein K466DRAFT_595729 [Polyporus arcularius HHB13444]